jgi:acyl dehydratase
MSEETQRLSYEDVEFGDDLPEFVPDVSMPMVVKFGNATGMTFWRFNDHEKARESGLPGAIVPGIMSQGILVAMIHAWAPDAVVHVIDTIFRSPLVVDSHPVCRGVVTDMNDDGRQIQLDLTICNEAGETPVLGTATITL